MSYDWTLKTLNCKEDVINMLMMTSFFFWNIFSGFLLSIVNVAKYLVHLALTFQGTSLIWYIHSVCAGKKFFLINSNWLCVRHLSFLQPACFFFFSPLFIIHSFHFSFFSLSPPQILCTLILVSCTIPFFVCSSMPTD